MKRLFYTMLALLLTFAVLLVSCDSEKTPAADDEQPSTNEGQPSTNEGQSSTNEGQSSTNEPTDEPADTPTHMCVFDRKVTTAAYLKSEASCTKSAVYYYSCSCGDKGTETFEHGKALAHTHDQKVTTPTYLKSEASCTESALYYYSCSCGDKGTATFEHGQPTEHAYDQKVTTATYLKTKATCTSSAVYYYSCVCGDKGSEFFSHGNAAGHAAVTDAGRAASCLASGMTEGSHCGSCGITLVAQEVIPATGHSETTDAAVAAGCTATGLTEGKHCSACGATLVAQTVVPATGHTEAIDAAVAATCTAPGLTAGKHCSVCNTVLVPQNTVSASGHNYAPATYTQPSTCTECGATVGGVLQKQPIYITKPYLPCTQYDTFRVTSCSYTTSWNGDGTYDVKVTFSFTNITTVRITAGIWATLSGIEPGDGTAKTLSPGASGSCTVTFFDVPAGSYQIIVD